MEQTDSLVALFLELVAIPSPSGREAAVASAIERYLRAYGIDCEFDRPRNGSDTGNLIARLSGDASLPTLLFVAHMDTVETGEKPIAPQVRNGVITSDGTTVLGADDKAAVACLLEALADLSSEQRRPTVVAVFTTREESGVMGSSLLSISDSIDFAFNIDGAGTLGDFVYQSLGVTDFTITIHGKAAHAANNPETGANALVAAGDILARLPVGKTEQGTTLNIGTIRGGTANNVVPDNAVLSGEARAYSQAEIDAVLAKTEGVVKECAAKHGCTYEFVANSQSVPPVSQSVDHPVVALARQGAERADLQFNLIKLSATTDANYLSAKYPTLTICRGSANPHGFDESIAVETLHGIKRLITAIIQEAARR